METNALTKFISAVKNKWDGLNSDTTLTCKSLLEELASTASSETWLAKLHTEQQESVELYRDPDKGFILLAHVEQKGRYRVPHNHGAGWVFYAVQQGVMEMATYGQVTSPQGQTQLVSRGAIPLKPGQCNVYLPGDIHDTQCLSDYVLMFRLTSSDFKHEKREGRLIQYLS